MARHNRHGSVRRKKVDYPVVYIDVEADFASIKLAPGIEKTSYLKDGLVFCEDARGKIIEIQLLSISHLSALARRIAA